MFSALTSESKQRSDSTRTRPAPERSQEVHPQQPRAMVGPMSKRAAILQRSLGNQAVLRMLEERSRSHPPSVQTSPTAPPGVLQAKLMVGSANDPLEQEADRVAGQVMRMPDPGLSSAPTLINVSRKCAACETGEKKELRMKPARAPDTASGEAPSMVHEVLRSPGQPLDPATRAFFEPRFGYDFSQVRVHTDARAAESARAVNALAYTVGREVVFAAEQYAPTATTTRRLLAHELAHVLQQNGALSTPNAVPGVAQRQSSQSQTSEDNIPPVPCDVATTSPGPPDIVQEIIEFPNDVSDLTKLDRDKIDNFIRNWQAQGADMPVRVDGFASKTGPTDHNWLLSCSRATSVAAELKAPLAPELDGIPESFISIFMHGETTEFPSEAENRRAIISADFPAPGPIPPGPPPIPPGPISPCAPHPADLTKIPAVMDANGFAQGAALLREWFSAPAHTRGKDDRFPVDASTITMDFVLGFDRAKTAFDDIFNSQLFANDAARGEILSMLLRQGILSMPLPQTFDFPLSVTAVDPDFDIQFKGVGSLLDPVDGLTAALGRFTFRIAVAGSVQVDPSTGMFTIIITDVGVHVRDSFDFEGFQPLGCWNVCTNQVDALGFVPDCDFVTNSDFRDWRDAHGKGGDFKVLSNLRVVHLPSPVEVTLGG